MPEVIEEGVTGFLVHGARALAEAIHKAAALSRRRVRESAVARFSVDRMVERYEELYRRLRTSATVDKYLATMWPSLPSNWFQKEPTALGGWIFILRWCRQRGLVPLERYIGLLGRWTVLMPLRQLLELLRSHLHRFLALVFAHCIPRARREMGSPIHCAGGGTADEADPAVLATALSFWSLSKYSTARRPIKRVAMAAVAGETAMPTIGPTTGTTATALAIDGAAITGATKPPVSAAIVFLPSASV